MARSTLNILLLSQYYRPEQVGPAIWLAELAQDLAAAGHRVSVLTAFPNHPDGVVPAPYRHRIFQRETLDGIDVRRTYIYASPRKTFARRAASFASFIASSLVGGALAAPRADVVYATLPPLPLGVTAAALARLKSAKLVVNLQDIHPDVAIQTGVLRNRSAIRFFQGMERWVYRHSDRIVVISEGFRENLMEKCVPAAKIRVVPNWADPDFVTPGCRDESLRNEWGRDKFVAVYSGGLTHNSCLEPLVEAASALACEPFQFVIIGDGVKRKSLEESARARQLSNLRFLPFQPLDGYPKVLATADINLVTLNAASAAASVPSKIYKLMASGRPVLAIVPRPSEIARLVEESGCGFVVEPTDTQGLVRVLRYAATHDRELERMGRSGRLDLERCLARRISTAKIAEVLGEVVQHG